MKDGANLVLVHLDHIMLEVRLLLLDQGPVLLPLGLALSLLDLFELLLGHGLSLCRLERKRSGEGNILCELVSDVICERSKSEIKESPCFRSLCFQRPLFGRYLRCA